MSKPLELTVHELCTCDNTDEPHYAGKAGWTRWFASDRAYMKRLTDAELAAEYWRAWNIFKTGNDGTTRDWQEYDRTITLRRIATLPHYTEAD